MKQAYIVTVELLIEDTCDGIGLNVDTILTGQCKSNVDSDEKYHTHLLDWRYADAGDEPEECEVANHFKPGRNCWPDEYMKIRMKR